MAKVKYLMITSSVSEAQKDGQAELSDDIAGSHLHIVGVQHCAMCSIHARLSRPTRITEHCLKRLPARPDSIQFLGAVDFEQVRQHEIDESGQYCYCYAVGTISDTHDETLWEREFGYC